MADESTNNGNKLITLANLQTFLGQLKGNGNDTGVFYSKDTINNKLDNKASLNGSISQAFSASILQLFQNAQNDHSIQLSCVVNNGTYCLKVTNTENPGNHVLIPLTNQRVLSLADLDPTNVFTTDNFDPDTKANVTSVTVGTGSTAPSYSFVSTPVIQIFRRLTAAENQTLSINTTNCGATEIAVSGAAIRQSYIFYLDDTELSGLNRSAGFYVTGSVTNNAAKLTRIGLPSTYHVYYNATSEELCYYSDGNQFITITTSSGGGGTIIIDGEEYTTATPGEIVNIFNN